VMQAQIGLLNNLTKNNADGDPEELDLGAIPTHDLLEAQANDAEVYIEPLGKCSRVCSARRKALLP